MLLNKFTTSKDWGTFEYSLTSQVSLSLPAQTLASEGSVSSIGEELSLTGDDNIELQPTCEGSRGCSLASTEISASGPVLTPLIAPSAILPEGSINTFSIRTNFDENERILPSFGVPTKSMESIASFVLSWSELAQIGMTSPLLSVSEPQKTPMTAVPKVPLSQTISSAENSKEGNSKEENSKEPPSPQSLATATERMLSSGPLTQNLKHKDTSGILTQSPSPSQTKSEAKASSDDLPSSVLFSTTQIVSGTTEGQFTTTWFGQYSHPTRHSSGLQKEDWTMRNSQASMVMSPQGWRLIFGTIFGVCLAFACIFYLQRVCYTLRHADGVLRDLILDDKAYDAEPTQQNITQTVEISRFSEDS